MARDIKQLHPKLQDLVGLLVTECNKQGLKIGIGECLRTMSEQDALYAKGRTDKTSGIVTNAKGSTYSSCHQWGIAFDFYRNDGKGAYNDNDGFFAKVGKIGQEIGLEWGGSWKSIIDKPHFQLADWGSTTSQLKKLYGTPDKFMATWNKANDTPKVEPPKKDTVKPVTKPVVKPVQTTKEYADYYTVKSGDSLIAIANKFKTTVDNLVKLNNIKKVNEISIGQKLVVGKHQLYRVVKGDTLGSIANKLLGSANKYKEIMEMNELKNTSIDIGQALKLPMK